MRLMGQNGKILVLLFIFIIIKHSMLHYMHVVSLWICGFVHFLCHLTPRKRFGFERIPLHYGSRCVCVSFLLLYILDSFHTICAIWVCNIVSRWMPFHHWECAYEYSVICKIFKLLTLFWWHCGNYASFRFFSYPVLRPPHTL